MKLMTTAAAAALCIGLFGAAGAAQAQEYQDLVVFGDSLSDNGNLALLGAAPPPPYFGGRFSDGLVWVEQLGFGPLGGYGDTTGSVDWAFGGAWTSTNPIPPPMTDQVAAYLGSGGTFGEADLVTLWGGANNIFNNLAPASVSANPFLYMAAVGTGAANDIGGLVDAVADAGAGTVLVANLPQLTQTPQFSAHPAGPLADAGVNAFNAQLLTNLFAEAAANPGTNVIHMDIYQFGQLVAEDPSRFGFTNISDTCFTGVSVCATPETYAYWDGVHPTEAMHALFAALATDYLYYGDLSVPTAAQGETALRHRAQATDLVFARIGTGAFDADRTAVSIIVDGEDSNTDARGLMPEVEDRSTSFRIALDHAVSENLILGGMFSFTSSDVEAGLQSFDSESVGIDAYLGWRSGGGLFINAQAGVGMDNYRDIERITMVPTVVNDSTTEGATVSAKLQAGWVFDMGSVAVSPRAAIGYVDNEVEGYTEDGELVRHVIGDRSIEAITAEASVRLEAGLGGPLSGYLEAGYRDNLEYDASLVSAGLANNPAMTLYNDVPEADGGMALIDAGLSADVMENLSLGVSYRGRIGDETESHMGRVSLNLRF